MVTQQIKNTAQERVLAASASMCFALECPVLSREESLALFYQWQIGRPTMRFSLTSFEDAMIGSTVAEKCMSSKTVDICGP